MDGCLGTIAVVVGIVLIIIGIAQIWPIFVIGLIIAVLLNTSSRP